MPKISPLSEVDRNARLADDVEVGPFCVVGPHVELGPGNRLLNHVTITGHTRIGSGNIFHPHCVIGGSPQDLKFNGEVTRLEMGSHNTIREAVTIHVGTEGGGGVTRLGNQNLLMVNAHIGHDAQFGDRCVIANNVMIAGHVVCGSNVVISAMAGVHHYVSIGDYAFLAGYCRIHHDVPPFVKIADDDQIRGLNTVGVRRGGFDEKDIEALDLAIRRLFYGREKPFARVLAEYDTMNGLNPHVKKMIEFLHRRDLGKHGRYLESTRSA